MLGSLHTLSYAKPRHWWHRLTSFLWRTQKASLVSQIRKGVTCFDIRFVRDHRADSEQNPLSFSAWSSAVGNVILRARPLWAIYLISRRCSGAYVEVNLESGTAGDAVDFATVCDWLVKQYPNLKFHGGLNLKTFEPVYLFEHNGDMELAELEYEEQI